MEPHLRAPPRPSPSNAHLLPTISGLRKAIRQVSLFKVHFGDKTRDGDQALPRTVTGVPPGAQATGVCPCCKTRAGNGRPTPTQAFGRSAGPGLLPLSDVALVPTSWC